MAEDTEDDRSEAVKRAMANKAKPKLTVINGSGPGQPQSDGGSAEGATKPKRRPGKGRAKPEDTPPSPDADDPGPQPDDGEGGAPPDSELLDGARRCSAWDQNDLGNANRLIHWFGLDLAYVPGMGWLVFAGTHWLRDEGELQVSLRAQQVVEKIKLEALVLEHSPGVVRLLEAAAKAEKKPEEERSKAERKLISSAEDAQRLLAERKSKRRAFAVTSGNRGRTVAMLAQAQSLRAIDPMKLDADPMKFNLRNGTFRFRREPDPERPEGSERMAGAFDFLPEPDRADMITKVADVDYRPDATCPEFLAFLERVQPDPAMRLFLQVAHAYALLVSGNDEQVVLFHYGQGANGKSVFIETIGRLAGIYRAVVSPETFTGDQQKQGQQASPDIARLHNTNLVTVEELPRGVGLKENMIKAASGGTKLVARFLQKEFFEFDPRFTTVMSGNDMPQVSGTDYGIWRRLKIVPWKVTIPEGERVPFGEMLRKFDTERSGILNWLLDGLMLWLANGLTPYVPAEVRAFTDDYREERDPVSIFKETCLVEAKGYKVQASDVYAAYEKWCRANGLKPYQQTAFGLRLNALGVRKEKGRVYHYLDVKLGDIPDIADPREPNPPRRPADDPGWTPDPR